MRFPHTQVRSWTNSLSFHMTSHQIISRSRMTQTIPPFRDRSRSTTTLASTCRYGRRRNCWHVMAQSAQGTKATRRPVLRRRGGSTRAATSSTTRTSSTPRTSSTRRTSRTRGSTTTGTLAMARAGAQAMAPPVTVHGGLEAYWPSRTDWSCEVKRIMNTNKL